MYNVYELTLRAREKRTAPALSDALRVANHAIGYSDREQVMVILLDIHLKPIGEHVVAIGAVDNCHVTISNIFKAAILANASGLVLAHNHPTGDVKPSTADVRLTKQVQEAGLLLGIPLHDHVITGPDPIASYSFCEQHCEW